MRDAVSVDVCFVCVCSAANPTAVSTRVGSGTGTIRRRIQSTATPFGRDVSGDTPHGGWSEVLLRREKKE